LILGSDDSTERGQLIGIMFYYFVSGMFMIVCIVVHLRFVKSDFFELVMSKAKKQTLEYSEVVPPGEDTSQIKVASNEIEEKLNDNKKSDLQRLSFQGDSVKSIWGVLKEIKLMTGLMLLIYIQTFMMFPGTTLKKQVSFLDETWNSVLLIATYNLFDTVGKIFTVFRSGFNQYSVTVLVIGRFFLFIPFILMASTDNIQVIDQDWFTFFNVGLFALTNGYATSCCFILGPESVKGEKKEIAGFILTLALQIGIMLGTFLALPFDLLPGEHN